MIILSRGWTKVIKTSLLKIGKSFFQLCINRVLIFHQQTMLNFVVCYILHHYIFIISFLHFTLSVA